MNLQKVNNQYAFLFEAACKDSYKPCKQNENKISFTLIPNEGDAFMLNPITGGFLTDRPENLIDADIKTNNKGAIFRVCVGYAMMSRIEDDFSLGCLQLPIIINAIMYEAHKFKPSFLASFKKITFERPYGKNEFFNELESFAGYELRLYIEF